MNFLDMFLAVLSSILIAKNKMYDSYNFQYSIMLYFTKTNYF